MIFENLAEKLQSTLKNLKGKGKLTGKRCRPCNERSEVSIIRSRRTL